jgi:hypothetical protein
MCGKRPFPTHYQLPKLITVPQKKQPAAETATLVIFNSRLGLKLEHHCFAASY